ncbi:hypothetical protein A7P53_02395 [Acinetobacter defluvii]|uniref:hypothetical protein n=1 Tax=Acinetobacter defluvii TaxID=1871111 RepID=UPI0014908398|nr:hypothetical protein [Acinetobacter defluvii]
MAVDLINLGLFILVPALASLFICIFFFISQVYNEDFYVEDDERTPQTPIEKFFDRTFKFSFIACCLSAFIFAIAMYFKTFYLLTIFLILAPLWLLWGYFKSE